MPNNQKKLINGAVFRGINYPVAFSSNYCDLMDAFSRTTHLDYIQNFQGALFEFSADTHFRLETKTLKSRIKS
jgi:hypothetical protein